MMYSDRGLLSAPAHAKHTDGQLSYLTAKGRFDMLHNDAQESDGQEKIRLRGRRKESPPPARSQTIFSSTSPIGRSLPDLDPLPKRRIIPRIQEPLKEKKVTIAAGFRCKDGIVLCADRQVSVPGAFKYHEKKIAVEVGSVWKVAFAFSGEPGFAREVQEKVMAAIRLLPTETPDGAQVKEILDDVLSNTTRLYTQGDAPLQLLVSLAIWMERPELLKFDGRALHAADNFNCLGVGNSPLIRFLSDTLYSPDIDLKTGVALAAYFIRKAEQYIDWCGGPIDVVTIEDYEDFCQWIPEDEITQKIEQMEKEEKLISRLLLRGVSSSNAL